MQPSQDELRPRASASDRARDRRREPTARAALATALVVGALGASLLWAGGCSGPAGDHPAPAPTDSSSASGTTTATTPASECTDEKEGCKCPTIDAVIDCKIYRKSGTYISCSAGKRTCLPTGRWGGCDGAASVWVPPDAEAGAETSGD